VRTSNGKSIRAPFLIGTESLYASFPQDMASRAGIAYGEPLVLAFPQFPGLVFKELKWYPVRIDPQKNPRRQIREKNGIVTLASIASLFYVSSVRPSDNEPYGSLQLTARKQP